MNLITSNSITMSSREIADLVGKDHKNVIRDIRVMLDELDLDGSELSHVEKKDARGYTKSFDLDRDLTETLITGYSVKLRHKVIIRLRELEQFIADKKSSDESRKNARLEAPMMTDAIQVQRKSEGKAISHYHFSNEFDLINRIALGQTSKQFRADHAIGKDDPIRDHLTACQIKCIEHLQRLNTSLIEIAMPFEERKAKLNQVYILRHKRALIAETLRLEG